SPETDLVAVFAEPSRPTVGRALPCFRATGWTADDAARLSWLASMGAPEARIADDATGIAIAGREERVARVAVVASSAFINVDSGLVAALDEEATAVVLAHELAHYYRAHRTTSVGGLYTFWY